MVHDEAVNPADIEMEMNVYGRLENLNSEVKDFLDSSGSMNELDPSNKE
jgi:hypothetical protein